MKINILGRTGPKSLKGKAISSMNALKHGAYAKTEILQFEDASERRRLEREIYKALKPADAIEESLADGLVNSYWIMERLKLRLSVRQESIFQHLTPMGLAELIGVPDAYRSHAPEYLKEPNTKFAKKDLKLPEQRYKMYLHLAKNSLGIANYQTVLHLYKSLFEGLHEFIGNDYGVPLIMTTGAGLDIQWQQRPKKVEEILLEYGASLYYKIYFDELRPKIRLAMSVWFFIQRREQRESDFQDELLNKEINRYQNLLGQFMKYRKTRVEHETLQPTPSLAQEAEKNETK